MTRESFVFYQSFLRAGEKLPDIEQGLFYKRLLIYAIDGENIDSKNGIVEAMFLLVKPQLDANNKRFGNGLKGGRPIDKKTKAKPNHNQTITKPLPNVNVNDNVNVNVNDNVNNNNIYKKFGDYVKLKEGEYEELQLLTGNVSEWIDKINEYCGMKGIKYKDYNLVIRNWFRKEIKSSSGWSSKIKTVSEIL